MTRRSGSRRALPPLLWGAGFLLAAGLLLLLRQVTGEAFYRAYIPASRAVLWALSWVFSLLPFSAAEAGICLGVVGITGGFFYLFFRAILRGTREASRRFGRFCARVFCAAGVLVFLFFALWGMAYGAPSLGEQMGLDVRPRAPEELAEVCTRLAGELSAAAGETERTEAGTLAPLPFRETARSAAKAFGAYTGRSAAPAKPVLLSIPLAYTYTTGIFIDFTAEANINTVNTEAALPFVMAHEMSHRHCIAGEDEANFFAFVVLYEQGTPRERYSALFSAWQYLALRLAETDKESYKALASGLPPAVKADLAAYREVWNAYEQTVISDLTEKVYDAYLHVQGESDGTKSYGNMVDLLLAYYLR